MILILMGATACGKSTLEQELDKRGILMKLTSHTTRPMRNNEVDGIDYHFISKEEFCKMEDNNEFIEERQYLTKYGYWCYGLSKKEIKDSLNVNSVAILDLNGAMALKQYMHEKYPKVIIKIMYIECSGKERLKRSLSRTNCDDKMCEEICRRYLDDLKWEKEAKKYCDFIATNETEREFENIIEFIKSYN